MKKLYVSLLALAAGWSLNAQQLPNASFEQAWVNCVPWVAGTSGDMTNANSTVQGTTPTGWTIANTVGTGSLGKTTVGEQTTGRTGNAVKVSNTSAIMSQVIPGYFTLGTPWSTATMTTNKDGGTFGGISFAYRPDAISFYYQSTGSEQPHFFAYAWKGTYKQANVPGNIATSASGLRKVTMEDRERNILGVDTEKGDTPLLQSGECITKIEQRLTATASSWTRAEFPFDYNGNTSTPEKFNVIFAAGNYLTTTPTKDNSITVDDVTLIYYSRLSDLKVNGTTIDGFAGNIYYYDMSSVEMPADESAISYSLLSNSESSSATVTLDQQNATATINVVNSNNGADIDGNLYHTYTIQFKSKTEEPEKPQYGGTIYYGTVTVHPDDNGLVSDRIDVANSTLHVIDTGNGTCQIVLPNFSLDGTEAGIIGDIIVNDVEKSSGEDGKTNYTGKTEGLSLLEGFIVANATVSGWTTSAGGSHLDINVEVTAFGGEEQSTPLPLQVEFNAYPRTIYNGVITIQIPDMDPIIVDNSNVHIVENGDGVCTFMLPNFSLDGTPEGTVGDIVVENVKKTEIAGGHNYEGSAKGISLAEGTITANAEVSGTTQDDGNAHMKIMVKWLQDPENDPDGNEYFTPIEVEFNGQRQITAIDRVEMDNSDKPVEYYNIQGMRINSSNLTPGIYIRRQGSDVKKVLINK